MNESSDHTLSKVKQKLTWILVLSTISIAFVVLLFQNNRVTSSEELIEKEITYIKRIKSGDKTDDFSLGGSRFSLPKNSVVSISNGPDFSVYEITTENDKFCLYSGMYPSMPNEIEKYAHKQKRKRFYYSEETEKELTDIISFAKNNGQFNKKIRMYEEFDYEVDSMIPPKFDFLNLTLFSDELKNIWVLQPSENEIGEIDIIIEQNNYTRYSYHLFGSKLNQKQRNMIIEVSKSIQ